MKSIKNRFCFHSLPRRKRLGIIVGGILLLIILRGLLRLLFFDAAQVPLPQDSRSEQNEQHAEDAAVNFATLLETGDLRIKFERVSSEHELSGSSISSILQDPKGFLWLGTDDGLNRYDGYTFTVYRHRPGDVTSIIHNDIHALLVDRSGKLWVGTPNGLDLFDEATEQFTHYRHDPQNPNSLKPSLHHGLT